MHRGHERRHRREPRRRHQGHRAAHSGIQPQAPAGSGIHEESQVAHLPARAARSRPRVGRQQAHPLTPFRSRGGQAIRRGAHDKKPASPCREAGFPASSGRTRNLLEILTKSGICRGVPAKAASVSPSEGKRVLLPLPGPERGACRGFQAEARLFRLPNPEAFFVAMSEKTRACFPRAGPFPDPEADGASGAGRVLRRKALSCAWCAESRGCPPFERSAGCSAPFRAGTQRALRLPSREGRTVCPCGHTFAALLPLFARRRGISRRKLRPSALRRTPAKDVP